MKWRAAEEGDPHRERGLLESALAKARMPPQQNALRAALSVLAARMGDLLGLGGNDLDVPIADPLVGPCALLRANAWERLNRPTAALELLVHYKFEGDPFGQQVARSFRALSSHLNLCPTAEPEAERQRLLTLGRRRIPWTTGMVVVLALGFYFLASAALMFVIGMVCMVAFPFLPGPIYGFFGMILAIPALLFFALFLPALRRTRNERELLARGVIAPARCLPGAQIAGESPGVVLLECYVSVVPDHDPPFEIPITLQTNRERVGEFSAGRPFTVRYFRNDILIEPQVR